VRKWRRGKKLTKDEGEKPIEPRFFLLTLVVTIDSAHPLNDRQLYNLADERIGSSWSIAIELLFVVVHGD
jgi:hypothetical protein